MKVNFPQLSIAWRCILCHDFDRTLRQRRSYEILNLEGDPPISEVFAAIRAAHATNFPTCPITRAEQASAERARTGDLPVMHEFTDISMLLRFIQ